MAPKFNPKVRLGHPEGETRFARAMTNLGNLAEAIASFAYEEEVERWMERKTTRRERELQRIMIKWQFK